ncbi:MAG TPA: DMT family transporter [Steroidobacter sp.]
MHSKNLRGVFFMLAAVAMFSVMDTTMKRLVEVYSAMQVTFLRGAASLPFLLAAAAWFNQWQDLVPRRWSLHLLRGVLSVVTLWLFVYAVGQLSLANTYTIFMSAPLLITALSVLMLGERVGWQRWLAVVAGLIGVIIVLKPSGAGLVTIGGLFALAAAAGYALSVITIRILSRTDTGAATVMWSIVLTTVLSGLISAFDWTPLDGGHWPLLLTLGATGALGQYFITEAFRRGSAPVLAPLEYTALAWGMLFDWLLWATLPTARMLFGALVIVGSGLYVIHRERVRTRVTA